MPNDVIRSVKIISGDAQTSTEVSIGALGSNVLLSDDQTRNIEATFEGATDSAAGEKGLVPAPALGETEKYLKSDGTWGNPAGGVTGVKGDAETDYRNGNVNITPTDIGLGNVGNFKAVSTVASQGLSTTEKENARNNIGAGTSSFSGSYNDLTNKPTLGTAAAKDVAASGDASTAQIVMGNDSRLTDARNAADVSAWAKASTKPAYTASEVGAIPTTQKGSASGVAELDANGKVPSAQLPSFVDDVIDGYLYNNKFYKEAAHTTEITGEAGKIYIDVSTNKTYRWSGSGYAEISESLALGETSTTAYRGDRGKTAYDHSQVNSGNPHNVTASDVGLGNVGNFKAVSTVASQGLTATEKSNARTNIGAGTSSLTLGETSSTAYRGDRGKIAYDHSQTTHASISVSGDTIQIVS